MTKVTDEVLQWAISARDSLLRDGYLDWQDHDVQYLTLISPHGCWYVSADKCGWIDFYSAEGESVQAFLTYTRESWNESHITDPAVLRDLVSQLLKIPMAYALRGPARDFLRQTLAQAAADLGLPWERGQA